MKKPDFFIVGAAKCGTTAMYTYLKQHREIFMPEVKEPQFFSTDLHFPIREFSTKEEYLSLFAGAIDTKRVGEASTTYLYSKNAAVEIKQFSFYASIIIMLRNPVDMIYALHSDLVKGCYENIINFEAALKAEEKRKCGLWLPNRPMMVEILFYREVAKYTQQVQRYLNVFGRKNVHVIIFDDLENDTPKVYRETLGFLDVDPAFEPDFQIINHSQQIRSNAIQSFLMNPQRFARSFVNTAMPRPLIKRLFSDLRRLNTKWAPRPPMGLELRRRLQAEFSPEVERLSEILKRDLSHWSEDPKL
jgi:hypothetical protein